MKTEELTPEFFDQTITLLNQSQARVLLFCAQNLANCSWAEGAELTALDANGFLLSVVGNGRSEIKRIEFDKPIRNAKELRFAIMQLGEKADPPDGIQRMATAHVDTLKASRYLKALCNHFDRKAVANYDDENGRVEFPFGNCYLHAEENALRLTVTAKSKTRFHRTKQVIADHLIRFSTKEELQVTWVDAVTN